MLYFKWVAINQLAIGRAFKEEKYIKILQEKKIKSVLCLCDENESPNLNYESHNILFKRIILPDHKSSESLQLESLEKAFETLQYLVKNHPAVYLHCFAAVERGPLLCLAYLIKEKQINFNDAIAYMMQINKTTNPMSSQIKVLKEFCSI